MTEFNLEKYNPNTNFLLYKTPNGEVKVDVLLQDRTVWMTQQKIAQLFGVGRPAITKHLKNIFESEELDEKVVCSILELTTQDGAIEGKIRKSDVSIAKNYLLEKELKPLNRIVSMYLDYAEEQTEKGIVMTMKDWAEKLDAFLKFNDKEILEDVGKVTAEIAKAFAESEFEKYRPIQNRLYKSDFDRDVKKLLKEKS